MSEIKTNREPCVTDLFNKYAIPQRQLFCITIHALYEDIIELML